jgi:5'-3' exoribonuclease 2
MTEFSALFSLPFCVLSHIFYRAAENRQNQNAKRRKLDQQMRNSPNSSNITSQAATPSSQSQFQSRTSTPDIKPFIHGLPPRPSFDTFGTATPAVASSPPKQSTPATSSPAAAAAPSSPANFATEGAKALAGSNHDVVANRRAIRMANMSAAEAFKAELAALTPLKPKNSKVQQPQESSVVAPPVPVTRPDTDEDIPGFDASPEEDGGNVARDAQQDADSGNALDAIKVEEDQNFGANGFADPPANDAALSGVKRKVEEVDKMEDTDTAIVTVQEEDDEPDKVEETVIKKLKVNADGSVDQEDTVRYVQFSSFRFRSPPLMPHFQTLGTGICTKILSAEVWDPL